MNSSPLRSRSAALVPPSCLGRAIRALATSATDRGCGARAADDTPLRRGKAPAAAAFHAGPRAVAALAAH